MYFAWENEKNLMKIMTLIMIFIFVIMISISPVFASSNKPDVLESFNLLDLDSGNYAYFIYSRGSSSYGLCVVDYIEGYSFFNWDNSNYYCYYNKLTDRGSTAKRYFYENGSWEYIDTSSNMMLATSISGILYSNSLVYKTSGEVYFSPEPEFQNPSFITTDEELSTGNFQTLKINAGDLDSSLSEDINFGIFDITGREFDLSTIVELPNLMVYSTKLNFSSKYMLGVDGETCYYIPQSDLGIDLSNDKKYYFVLANDEGERFDQVVFTVGGLTAEEELQNKQDQTNQKLDEQTNAIKESNETNKGIWETIKDILSYINPFSENFFVYKLIELLLEAIKSLFIPSDDFFSTYFTDLKDWFSDRLGFLFYPFELIIDILNKILNIDFENPIFNIPDIHEPFTNKKIISATTFNLNDLLTNNTWKTVHDIYLILLDAFIVFGLVNLFLRKYKEVTTE